MLVYDLLRYVVPGVLWAWLFWRFGFVTAEVASVGCHIFLQPGFGILLLGSRREPGNVIHDLNGIWKAMRFLATVDRYRSSLESDRRRFGDLE